ncbi:MAG: carbonic anhydrase [Acidobacteria bacterium]|nr:carbonic anhydrase [Acidobacteriota bacterium]
MEKLVRGIHTFQTTHFNEHQDLFTQLSKGQTPETLLITCSDSRIMPGLLTQSKPGELFVLRNAGNIVPPYGASTGGEGATIEYAVAALQVSHIVVMGHSHCGAMKGLLQPEDLKPLPLVEAWLKHAEATRRVVLENYQDCTGNDLLNAAIKENVLVQLDNLRTYPAVAARLAKGNLTLHALIYQIETGQILAYDPEKSQFVPVTATYAGSMIPHRPRIAVNNSANSIDTTLERAA